VIRFIAAPFMRFLLSECRFTLDGRPFAIQEAICDSLLVPELRKGSSAVVKADRNVRDLPYK